MLIRMKLLGSAAFLLPLSTVARAQETEPVQQPSSATAAAPGEAEQPQPAVEPSEDYGDEEIVVMGARPRGSVVGDIPPEQTLDSRDVRATGATNISELLDVLAPQIGSARGREGGPPVLLLNGRRVSGFRELRDIPAEAIQRVEILPEEVALKYGYRADQRVVNIVLRQRFHSTVAEARANAATEGGYLGGTGDLTRLMIGRDGRTQINVHAESNGMLTEAERDIIASNVPAGATENQALEARSLVPSKTLLRGSGVFNRTIFGDVSATLNTEVEHIDGRSLFGLGETLLEPLVRDTNSNGAHLGTTLNWDKSSWNWNVTGNGDYLHSVTRSDRDDVSGDRDRASSDQLSGDLTGTANGKLFSLPAGDAMTTLRLGLSTVQLDSETRDETGLTPSDLGRTSETASVNVDLPVSRRNRDFSALGNLTLNANAEVDHLSDFGTLTVLGAGANWSPADRLNFISSWTREEGAPTLNQLGDPIITTPNARIFDFTTGETVQVTATTGGNPDLLADRRNVWKIGGNWQPIKDTDLRLRAEYVHSTIDNPVSNISATPQIEAAFPERFVRDCPTPAPCLGPLISVDLRPINFDQARRDTLRIGFDFSKPLKSRRPSQSVMDQIRAQFGGRGRPVGGAGAQGENAPPSPPPEGAPPPDAGPPPGGGRDFGGPGGGRGFGGGGFGRGGFGSRGRLQFSITDTVTLVDEVRIAPGIPKVDYLHGDAAGSTGGTPRHQVQAQAGWSNNGLGARVAANWRSGTHVDSLDGNDLDFSPYGTFDLRLFANPGDISELALKQPWLRGTQIRLDANNIFNSKPKVRDASGEVPLNYQADLLQPLGRTIMISFRKLFSPPPSWYRQQREREQQQANPPR